MLPCGELQRAVVPAGAVYMLTAAVLTGKLSGLGRHAPSGGASTTISLIITWTAQPPRLRKLESGLEKMVKHLLEAKATPSRGGLATAATSSSGFIPPRRKDRNAGGLNEHCGLDVHCGLNARHKFAQLAHVED